MPRATQLEEIPMAPVGTEAEADIFGALGFEKVEAAQQDTLRGRKLLRDSAVSGLARHSVMQLRHDSLEALTWSHLSDWLPSQIRASLLYCCNE